MTIVGRFGGTTYVVMAASMLTVPLAHADSVGRFLQRAIAATSHMKLTAISGMEVEKMIAGFEATPSELVKKAFDYTHVE